MPVKINSTGAGSVTLSSGSIATDVIATFPATTGNAVVDTAVQTLTNKTLVGAVMTSMASSVLTLGTAQASTSGTSIDFTGIPSWVRRVTVMLRGVSTNGNSIIQAQLGTSAGFVAAGYFCQTWQSNTGNAGYTSGIVMGFNNVAAVENTGLLTLVSFGSNVFVGSGSVGRSSTSDTAVFNGSIALPGVLDRIRITTVGGTDLFDAGSINIVWE